MHGKYQWKTHQTHRGRRGVANSGARSCCLADVASVTEGCAAAEPLFIGEPGGGTTSAVIGRCWAQWAYGGGGEAGLVIAQSAPAPPLNERRGAPTASVSLLIGLIRSN